MIRVLRFNRHRVRERNTPRNLLLLSDVASTIIISTMIRVHESSTLKFEREKDKYMYFEKQSYTKSGFYIFRISSLLLFKRALINKFIIRDSKFLFEIASVPQNLLNDNYAGSSICGAFMENSDRVMKV